MICIVCKDDKDDIEPTTQHSGFPICIECVDKQMEANNAAPEILNLKQDGVFTKTSHGFDVVEDAETIRMRYCARGKFAITRHYAGRWFVYTRLGES